MTNRTADQSRVVSQVTLPEIPDPTNPRHWYYSASRDNLLKLLKTPASRPQQSVSPQPKGKAEFHSPERESQHGSVQGVTGQEQSTRKASGGSGVKSQSANLWFSGDDVNPRRGSRQPSNERSRIRKSKSLPSLTKDTYRRSQSGSPVRDLRQHGRHSSILDVTYPRGYKERSAVTGSEDPGQSARHRQSGSPAFRGDGRHQGHTERSKQLLKIKSAPNFPSHGRDGSPGPPSPTARHHRSTTCSPQQPRGQTGSGVKHGCVREATGIYTLYGPLPSSHGNQSARDRDEATPFLDSATSRNESRNHSKSPFKQASVNNGFATIINLPNIPLATPILSATNGDGNHGNNSTGQATATESTSSSENATVDLEKQKNSRRKLLRKFKKLHVFGERRRPDTTQGGRYLEEEPGSSASRHSLPVFRPPAFKLDSSHVQGPADSVSGHSQSLDVDNVPDVVIMPVVEQELDTDDTPEEVAETTDKVMVTPGQTGQAVSQMETEV